MRHQIHANLPFLNTSQILEQASLLDAIHKRTVKAIERLERDLDARKKEAAGRWKNSTSLGLSPGDAARIEQREVHAALISIRRNAEKELDAIMREAGAAHSRVASQRPFYDSPVKTLNRVTLGDARRGEYVRQLEGVGPAELAHLGQWAISTANAPLAAAIVSRLDAMPSGSRPFNAATLANALALDEHRKAVEAIKIADLKLQATVVAIRTWRSGTPSPMHAVSLALQGRTLDSEVMRELEADDAAA